jgi:hypothetical protein
MRGEKKTHARTESCQGRSGITSVWFVLCAITLIAGAVYLYQVNDLATKGYEIKEIETKITDLEKESKKMQIREVEIRSMYSLEKATQNLELVSPENVSYLEMDSPVAMK